MRRLACAHAQSDQCLCYSLSEKYDSHKLSIFWLVSVAEQTRLNLTWSDTSKTDFLISMRI